MRRLGAIVKAFRNGGASALELGFPFSDPIADGPVLEAAHARALRHGTTWSDLKEACREASRELPVAVMTYANPLWHRGLSSASRDLASAGASGLIVPDLSLEESGPFSRAARAAGLSLVLLAAPGVSSNRLRIIASRSRGFLYLVSRYGTTGRTSGRADIDLAPLVRASHETKPRLPVLVGFGVRDRWTATRALASGADGVIVGSAVEEHLAPASRPGSIERWLRSIATATVASRPPRRS